MHEAAGLLDAIVQSPEDDTPRLIYADWLEDRGDCDRAELIRVQIERARLPESDRQARRLLRREKALLAIYPFWLEPVRGIKGEMSRGFLDRVNATPLQILENVALFDAQIPCRNLVLRVDGQLTGHLRRLAQLPLLGRVHGLRVVKVPTAMTSLGDAGLAELLKSPYLTDLRSLSLPKCDLTVTSTNLLCDCPGLQTVTELDLPHNRLAAESVRLLAYADKFAAIKRLNLAGNWIGRGSAEILAGSSLQLEALDLSETEILSGGVQALTESSFLRSVRELGLDRLDLRIRAAQHLARCEDVVAVRSLSLNRNRLEDVGVRELAESQFLGELQSLKLRHNRITPTGVVELRESARLGKLKHLDLANNHITPLERQELYARFGRRGARF